ncbi:MAG: 23S rRNA (guanosine-2'-O-)-methyltransferase RlmB [Dehalococcoidia bacterium]|nr:23S rRNA (guanosine-2'-O-)-methyltransferase RlmB [Bacillota bacterium]
MPSVIESAQNQYLKLYSSLKKRNIRDELNLLPLEGVKLVSDVLSRGIVPQLILVREDVDMDKFPFLLPLLGNALIVRVAEKLFDRTAFTDSPQGIMAITEKPSYALTDLFVGAAPLILVADAVQDPGNLGTMLRSAVAAGAAGAVLLPGTVDSANPKTLRAAMGAHYAIPVVEAATAELLNELQSRQIPLVAAAATATITYDRFDWSASAAVVIGNEGAGVSPVVAEAADAWLAIPLATAVESLNAAVAMSVIFFEAARQRRSR